jgi:protein-export membrane protein SecD
MHYSRWQTIAIFAALVLALILSVPNVLPKAQQDWARANLGLRPMTLGLDLQGGANVLLELDRNQLVEDTLLQTAGDMRAALRAAKVGYSNVQRSANSVSVKITKPEDMAKAEEAIKQLIPDQGVNILTGASSASLMDYTRTDDRLSLTISEAGLQARIAAAIKQSLTIVGKRINGLGTTEPVIQQQGADRIVVQVPGLQDTGQLKDLLKGTAKLMFQLLCEEQPTGTGQNPPQDCVSYPNKEDVDRLVKEKTDAKLVVTEQDMKSLPQMWVQTSSRSTVDGEDLTDAQPSFDQQNRPVVTFRFNSKGAQRFAKLTADNVNRPFAIVLDKVVQSAPNINEPILGGSGQISGQFSTQETANLAIVLRSGALPAKLNIVEERTVGPSLGSDSVRAGFMASIIGVIGVMLFMLLPYGLFGWFANFALMGNLILLIAIMSFFGFTLTLPGIAGILLTLGMAVDSNVLIYERIREEWKSGRTALSSIDYGFKAALGTVLDANVTTLIAAVVLFGVGSGPIRGFAVTLALGIFTTMFTAFTLTKLVVAIWVKRNRPKEINL